LRIALIGYGRMGRAVEGVAEERGHDVVARLRSGDDPEGGGVPADALGDAEVAIEFTRPDAAVANIERAAAAGLDLAVGTTGWYDDLDRVRSAVEGSGIGLIYSANFSLGTQLFFRLVRHAARMADRLEGYDAYVLEAHHSRKRDHPSGTARRLAEILLGELSGKTRWVETPGDGEPDPKALQVAVLRAGENPGMHVVGLDGPDDVVELRHQARSRRGFARGAVAAAEWIRGRSGVFTIDDMLGDTLGPEVPT
jgi:4-hydroxy-tetrahydrodipicolinate reductase